MLRMHWPAVFAKAEFRQKLSPGILLLDDAVEIEDNEQCMRWRHWLQLYNILQVLPGFMMVTLQGLNSRDYQSLPSGQHTFGAANEMLGAQEQAWVSVRNQAMSSVVDGLNALQAYGMPVPDQVGFELEDHKNAICAEAELAWTAAQIVLLLDHQEEYQSVWKEYGWNVVLFSESWAASVQNLLYTYLES